MFTCRICHNKDLLIHFPPDGRINILPMISSSLSDNVMALPSTTEYRVTRSVRFATTSRLKLFNMPSTKENETRWTSVAERKLSRQNRAFEVFRMRQLLEFSINEGLPDDVLILCIGIENLLSNKSIKRAIDERSNHVRVILSEQQRQRDLGVWDDDKLAQLSAMSSRKCRGRAFKLADGYSKMNVM